MEEGQQTGASALISCQALEQFLLLAKTARGPAVIELIKQVLEAPGVYVFGELLMSECVKELSSEEGIKYVNLLKIFAYGTYSDYKANEATLPPLNQAQTVKLKHLTVITLASKCPVIPYTTLLKELEIADLRELEDLIIEAIYAGIIQAKLDQKNAQLRVESFIGRDIKLETIGLMVEKLENWCANCGSMLLAMEEQMQRANQLKIESAKDRERHELDIKQLKQSIKVSGNEKGDDEMKDFAEQMGLGRRGIRGSTANKGRPL